MMSKAEFVLVEMYCERRYYVDKSYYHAPGTNYATGI